MTPFVSPSRSRGPMRLDVHEQERRRALAMTAAVLVATYFAVRYLWSALVPVIGAGALYYLFSPVVHWLGRRGVPRWVSATLLVVLLAGGLGVAIGRVVPRVYAELRGLLIELPHHAMAFQRWLEQRDLGWLTSGVLEKAVAKGQTMAPGGLVTWTVTLFGSLTTAAFTIVLAIYLLAGGHDLGRAAVAWVPPSRRERWIGFGRAASRLLAGYVRARVFASVFIAVSYWIAFVLVGLPQALLLAVAGGLLNLIPVVGPLIAAIPALLVAAFQGWSSVIAVAVVMIVSQQIESSLIGPLVEGRFVRLPPVVVVVVVALGATLMGIPGMLIAVPVAAVTRQALAVFYRGTWEPESRARGASSTCDRCEDVTSGPRS